MAFLSNFRDFRVFVFGYFVFSVISEFSFLAQNENPEITENLYFWFYKAQMNVDMFFITILTF